MTTFAEDIKSLFDKNLHKLLLTLPVGGILIFTILPLIFMIAMAFTNYSKVDSHLVLFDWVGLENFRQMFDVSGTLGKTFWSVLGWTIVWAVFATGLNYILGMLLALLINRKGTKIKGFWRLIFYFVNCHSAVCVTACYAQYAKSGRHYQCNVKKCWLDSEVPAVFL